MTPVCENGAMRMQLSEVAAVTRGELLGEDVAVSGASIDTRTLDAGALFVPIVADRDGHDFITAAFSAGAAAHLTEHATGSYPAVRVADTALALEALGSEARRRLTGHVIAVTGSVGKTTTKDLLRAALAPTFRTHASFRSFNNELGVPLTLLQAPEDTETLVCEMGARGLGHISKLCAVARPTLGVVLAVAAAHTELFGDLEAVARAKRELVESLDASATAILNADDPRVMAMAEHTDAAVVSFGGPGDVRAENVVVDERLRPSFDLVSPWGGARCSLSAAGVHTVTNALAAAAAAMVVGVGPEAVADGLANATISPWRMEVTRSPAGVLIINDAYNANTMSMNAAIDALLAVDARRRIAVVGLMAELGARHTTDHLSIGDRLRAEGIEVISVAIPEYGGTQVAGIEDAAAVLHDLEEGDAVLIKASRVTGLERLVGLIG